MRIVLASLSAGFDESKIVNDHIPVIEKTGKFSDRGVFSERIFGRMPSSGRDYACDHGCTEGRFYEGTVCIKCGTVVTCRDIVFSKRGWADIGERKFISPLFYQYFSRVVGVTQLVKIIHPKRVLTMNGIVRNVPDAGPFDGMGLIEFANRWPEVIDHFEHKRRSDPKVVEFARIIRANPDLVMTSKMPIFNHILRPALVVDKQMIFDEVNNLYNLLISNSNALADYTPEEATDSNVNEVLWRIQVRANEVFNHILHIMSGKGGYLRGDMLGARVNFSSRCVITPLGPGHDQDEVELPYLAFLELYRFQITNLLVRMYGVTLAKANDMWHEAQTKFDRSIYAAMLELIRRGDDGNASRPGLSALFNRNPTISFGSILLMRITGIKMMYDFTMSVHNGILKLISGDYDGDVCAIIPLLDREFTKAFRIYNPRLMVTSRDGPVVNRAMLLDKDYILGLSVLTEDAKFAVPHPTARHVEIV